jgi:uncharacterized protein (DUF1810 family)
VDDPFGLARFVEAQDRAGTYDRALEELARGAKQGHWMWFVFPQLVGLGSSETARHFAIGSLDEAAAYLAHPILGCRLVAAARVLADLAGARAEVVVGPLDARKLRSSMTLFSLVAGHDAVFDAVLAKYFGGEGDRMTIELLRPI